MTIVNQTSFGLVGVNIYATGLDQLFPVGTRTRVAHGANKDSSAEVVYCYAGSGDITSPNVYLLGLTTGTAYNVGTQATTSSAATATGATIGSRIAACVPCASAKEKEYFWAYVRGTFPAFVGASAVLRTPLYSTATAGLVDDTATTHQLDTAYLLSTISASNQSAMIHSLSDVSLLRVS